MKIRNGFVSNSSSSSFVILKDSLSKNQQDMIFDYQQQVKVFTANDETCVDLFSYCDSDPWRIIEYDDFIFGETSMDNFSMQDYFDYIKINFSTIGWDDGYNDNPTESQLDFITEMKQKYRKEKIIKLDNLD